MEHRGVHCAFPVHAASCSALCALQLCFAFVFWFLLPCRFQIAPFQNYSLMKASLLVCSLQLSSQSNADGEEMSLHGGRWFVLSSTDRATRPHCALTHSLPSAGFTLLLLPLDFDSVQLCECCAHFISLFASLSVYCFHLSAQRYAFIIIIFFIFFFVDDDEGE